VKSKSVLVSAGGILCLLTLAGCPPAPAPDPKTGEVVALSPQDLNKAPYDVGEIILIGTTVPSTIKHESDSKGFTLTSLMEDGQAYEIENYESDASSLKFKGTDTEAFDPAIPLLTLPFHAPDQWTWSGKMTLAGKTFVASATAASVKETLNAAGGPYETVKVTLELSFKGTQAKRKLTFWLSKDAGIVKRDFAQSSTRQPASEKEE